MKKIILLVSFCILIASGAVADGNKVVPEEIARIKDLKYAVDFLNRYVEYVKAPSSEKTVDILRRTKEDGLKYIKGNDLKLATLPDNADFNISFERGSYMACWKVDDRPFVEVTFPANFSMLTFSDKKDLEKKMADALRALPDKTEKPEMPVIDKKNLRPVSFSDLFVLDKGYFITPRLQNIKSFKQKSKKDKDCELLTEDSGIYTMEAIQNMMLTGYSKAPVNLNIELVEYGYKSSKYKKPLFAIFKMLEEEGSVPYWGLEPGDNNTIKGLYVWKNEAGGFSHVMTVTVPPDIMKNGGDLDVKLHCYVRMDNLKSLFEEYL